MALNLGKGYFNDNRPEYVKGFNTMVRMLCKKKFSLADAEAKAFEQYGTVKDWIISEQLQGRSGDTYLVNPCPIEKKPNAKVKPNANVKPNIEENFTSRSSSPYNLMNPNSPLSPHSNTRKRSRRSKKSRKLRKLK